MEKEEMPPSAGGSLVWKADDLCAPSSCQYAPLKQRNTEGKRFLSWTWKYKLCMHSQVLPSSGLA